MAFTLISLNYRPVGISKLAILNKISEIAGARFSIIPVLVSGLTYGPLIHSRVGATFQLF